MVMQEQVFSGVTYVRNPYTGGFVKKGLNLFEVKITGKVEVEDVEEPENPMRWMATYHIDGGSTIEEAISKAEALIQGGEYPVSDDVEEWGSFVPEAITIVDRSKNLVASATVVDESSWFADGEQVLKVKWLEPVRSNWELESVNKDVKAHLSEAAFEASWDNYSTAERLREEAGQLKRRFTAPQWRQHARKALGFAN